VKISSKSKANTVTLSRNLAHNLKLDTGDTIKILPSQSDDSKPEPASAVGLSPTEESLNRLESLNGGDELTEDDLTERFIQPYLESGNGNLQVGHLLTLRDVDGKTCEFVVNSITTPSTEDPTSTGSEGSVEGWDDVEVNVEEPVRKPEDAVGYESVGGCDKAVKLMRELVEVRGMGEEGWGGGNVRHFCFYNPNHKQT
jgi:hypothetical protein